MISHSYERTLSIASLCNPRPERNHGNLRLLYRTRKMYSAPATNLSFDRMVLLMVWLAGAYEVSLYFVKNIYNQNITVRLL